MPSRRRIDPDAPGCTPRRPFLDAGPPVRTGSSDCGRRPDGVRIGAMSIRVLVLAVLATLLGLPAATSSAAAAPRPPHVIATIPVGDGPSGIAVDPRADR